MPVHDWTKVSAGTWHDFHVAWITEIRNALNRGLLPKDYYAQAEQIIGDMGPDVLTLRSEHPAHSNGSPGSHSDSAGGVAIATKQPQTRFTAQAEMDEFVHKRRTVTIRHSSDDQIIAMIELISPGNKAGMQAIRALVDKAVEAIYRGYHLLIVDLFPPSPRDPEGIPALIWSEFAPIPYHLPPGEPLTLCAIDAGHPKQLYVNTTAVGQILKDMPVFLEPGGYVTLPLESTYTAAFQGVPWKWQQVLNQTP